MEDADRSTRNPLSVARWSPARFDPDHEVTEVDVAALLDAARWAPSAGNSQPWAFVAARRGSADHATLVSYLTGSSRPWAPDAALLVANLCHLFVEGTTWEYSEFALYDLGQAVAHMTLEAAHRRLSARQFRAFDRSGVAAAFGVPPHWQVTTLTAFGRPASPPAVRRDRRSLDDVRWPVTG